MGFNLSKKGLENKVNTIVLDRDCLKGVRYVANLVSSDIKKVFDVKAEIEEYDNTVNYSEGKILVYTQGIGDMDAVYPDLTKKVMGKREVYALSEKNGKLIIAGSDKRGTIYGLFRLSELLGVSALTDWNNVNPLKTENFEFNGEELSKEPSVRFRGFFINDEWPAFGNWCNERFGGFNKECYAKVFELLLRLKGNYLWPAMWSAVFSEDGPGLSNAELADELGVVIGMSHHEPCLRNGEEYSHVRGKDSIYGDAWNFRTNEKGITKFWEDGLKRNGRFENVITVGMRGEADSTIMGKDATLKDNIDLLRDVLKCQRRLIREIVNEDSSKTPMMLALYKEVEPFYYGDENTEGLMNSPELEDVILMLCDDNFGNLRTVPTKEMRNHKGGFGMYYHFDYHGWPISYEWVNSSYLPKVWEQMSAAYEFGIRDLWIVNVGDIFTTEYPLCFFLDMAYDYEKWGEKNINAPALYTTKWVEENFRGENKSVKESIYNLLMGYTKIAAKRRPEAMNEKVYTAESGEAEAHAAVCSSVMELCEKLKGLIRKENESAYFQLVYYPLMANLNVHKLWCDTAMNNYLTEIGACKAKDYADRVNEALIFDKELIDELHTMEDGKWYGMGMSKHIGFKNWNDEECHYPILYSSSTPFNKGIVAWVPGSTMHTQGGDWTRRTLVLEDNKEDRMELRLYALGGEDTAFSIINLTEGISLVDSFGRAVSKGLVKGLEVYSIFVKNDNDVTKGGFTIQAENKKINVELVAPRAKGWKKSKLVIEASEAFENTKKMDAAFVEIPGYGKYKSAMKVFPVLDSYALGEGPSLSYEFETDREGEYTISFHTNPSNPAFSNSGLYFGMQINDEEIISLEAVSKVFKVGDDQPFWMQGVLENERITRARVNLKAGRNVLKLYAMTPCLVLERITIED